MATLGNTNEYGSAQDLSLNVIVLIKVTAPQNGVVSNIKAYVQGGGWTANHKGFLFDENGKWLKSGSINNINGSAPPAWVTSTMSTSITTGGIYYIGWGVDTAGPDIMSIAGATANYGYENNASCTYASPTAGFNPSTQFVDNNDKMSLYMTYTPSNSGASGEFTEVNYLSNANIEKMGGIDMTDVQDLIGLTKA